LLIIGAAAGVAWALTREETYTASASLSFRDTSQDLALFGIDTVPQDPASIRAAVNAERVTREEVTEKVEKRFEGELSAEQLAASVEARVGAQTQLVVLEATAANPALAANIANSYASVAAELGAKEIDQRLARVEKSLLNELDKIDTSGETPEPGAGVRLSVLESRLSQVQTLRDISEPVQVVQTASQPADPDNPSPVTGGLVGGLAGLLLGLVLAFTRDSLDRRIRNSQDVHSELGFSILGRVPDSAMGYPGLADPQTRAPMSEADFEAFRVIRTNLAFLSPAAESAGQVVLVAGSQPEEGKTTVSMSLASAAAIAGQRVLLLEGDLRRPSFAKRLKVNPGPGLAEYLRGQAEPSQVVQAVELFTPLSASGPSGPTAPPVAHLACITAGAIGADSAELLSSARFSHFIGEIREAYDLIVIDSSPLLAVVDPLQLVERADTVLLCARAHQTTRDELRATRSALGNLPQRPYGVVITGLRRDGPDSYAYYYGY
jgi:capsular exopolysaccharide synthesis family protein